MPVSLRQTEQLNFALEVIGSLCDRNTHYRQTVRGFLYNLELAHDRLVLHAFNFSLINYPKTGAVYPQTLRESLDK